MTGPVVKLEYPLENCAVVTLTRPQAKNALSLALRRELTRLFKAELPGRARVVALTGASSTFCAGRDLNELANCTDVCELTGNFLDVRQALAWGLINEGLLAEELRPAALRLAADMLSKPRDMLRACKRLIDEGGRLNLGAAPQACIAPRTVAGEQRLMPRCGHARRFVGCGCRSWVRPTATGYGVS